MPDTVGIASRRGTRDHNCDAARVYRSQLDGTVVAAVVDGAGNSADLAELASVMATVAVRFAIRHGGLPALITAGALLLDDDYDGAAVLAIVPPGGHATVCWVGDCRAYRWGTELRQYTTDHTMGQQLRASGGVPVEFAATHDHWLRVGLRGATAATVRQVWIPDYDQDLAAGDRILLTSDGVHDALPHDDLVRLVEAHQDPQELADAIAGAVDADDDGYRDDATVVVLAIGESS